MYIIFQVVLVGRFHSITPSLRPSLPVRRLKTGAGELQKEKARDALKKI